MKRTIALILAAAVLLPCAAFAQERVVSAEKGGFKLRIAIQGDTAKISLAAPTKGWVAIGLDPVKGMKGADFLIGFVKGGITVVRDDYGTGPFAHASDASQGGIDNIMSFTGEEQAGATRITFTVPVNSGDAKDGRWTPGKHVVILAFSMADNFSSPHISRTMLEIEIPEVAK